MSQATDTPTAAAWDFELEELEKLINLLPESVRRLVEDNPEMTDCLEMVLDLGRPPLARFPSGDVKLSTTQVVTREDLEFAVNQLGLFGGDNRAGIDRTLHRISCIRNRRGDVIGLTCRVGRAITGSADLVSDLITSGSSILFLGRPGVGKTTTIREVCRVLSDVLERRVVIVDTSNEIGGDGDIPHVGIGRSRRMQVADTDQQHKVMIEAVENHMPEVVVIDEIGTMEECIAARTIAQRGVMLIATAHGQELENVIKNPALADLVGGIQSVTLGDEEAKRRGVQKSILERGGSPTFDICVEMIDRSRWRIHTNVAASVDVILAGGQAGVQMRERQMDGAIVRSQTVHQMPKIVFQRTPSASSSGADGGSKKKKEQGRRQENQVSTSSRDGREGEMEEEEEGGSSIAMELPPDLPDLPMPDADDGLSCRKAWATRKKQQVHLARSGKGPLSDTLLRVMPFDIEADKMFGVMKSLGLVDSFVVAYQLEDCDCVLGLRPKVKAASELRRAAKEDSVPIYALKDVGASSLARALKALLAQGPVIPGSKKTSSGVGFGGDDFKAPDGSLKAPDAVEEVEEAISIVIPTGQALELLPRTADLIQAQIEFLKRRDVGLVTYEILGMGDDTRLKIMPSS